MRKRPTKGDLLMAVAVSLALCCGSAGSVFAANPQAARTAKAQAPSSTKKTVAAAPASTASSAANNPNQRIVDFIRAAALALSPTVDISVVSRLPSKFGNLDTVTVAIREGDNTFRQEVLITPDNKYAFIPARVFDLSQNPYAETMSHLHLASSPTRGNLNSKVTIVEFSDFECPVCGRVYKMIESDVMKQYGDKVKFVYKNFPLPQHPWAEDAAVAAMCAYAQKPGAFWVFYHSFFDNQATITKENVRGSAMTFGRKAELDMAKFQECYDKKESLPQVNADQQEAAALGVPGTPLFLINGHPISGAEPFSTFQMVIDQALKEASK